MMWYGYHMGYGPFWGVSAIFTVLWWFVIIFLIVSFVRFMRQGKFSRFPFEKAPLDILKERYAKGEIDKAEFEEKRKDLEEVVK